MVHELRFFDHRLRAHRERCRRHHVDGDDVQDDIRLHRKQVLPAHRHAHERRRRRKTFVPAGKGKLERTLHDRGPHDRTSDPVFGGDELLAQALRVGIDVRPTPVFGFRDPELGQPRSDPVLALPGNGEVHGLVVTRVTSFREKTLARVLAKPIGERFVAGFVLDTYREPLAVVDLLVDAELGSLFAFPWEVADHGLVLPDFSRTVAGDEAGAHVHERGPFHPFGERQGVERAVHVRLERGLERRIEGHAPGGVQEHIDIVRDRLGALGGEAEVLVGDVATDDDDFLAQELIEVLAVALAQRIERGRRGNRPPEPALALGL